MAEWLPQKEDLQNPVKWKHAMAKEVDWYKGMLVEFVRSAETSGKIKNNLRKMLKHVLKLHLLGFLINTCRDSIGWSNSAFWAGTEDGCMLKEKYGTKISSQIHDLEALLLAQQMYGQLLVRQDVVRLLTGSRVLWDVFSNMMLVAWQSQICIGNWPSTEFPKFNTSDEKHMSMVSTWGVLEPWCMISKENEINEARRLKGSIYELNYWGKEDQNLTWKEQANIALVTDNHNKVLVHVWDVASWVKACENRIQAKMNRGRPQNVVEDERCHKRVGLPRHESEELNVDKESPMPMEPLQKEQKHKQMWEGDNGEKQKVKKQNTRAEELESDRASTLPGACVLKEHRQRWAVSNTLVQKAEKERLLDPVPPPSRDIPTLAWWLFCFAGNPRAPCWLPFGIGLEDGLRLFAIIFLQDDPLITTLPPQDALELGNSGITLPLDFSVDSWIPFGPIVSFDHYRPHSTQSNPPPLATVFHPYHYTTLMSHPQTSLYQRCYGNHTWYTTWREKEPGKEVIETGVGCRKEGKGAGEVGFIFTLP
ncbi:hypothetical protein BT96DRAFT_937130 [Gymnopus androsaceus JB14]|uniref:Uncharacterized protein n=1 Tax=Gymnopus androsaceus JB14 TaxID=1447944 RepID=A0A6A4HWW9_9AGAR|nr:hypothetical protein BT96DRAFT_937130 [Gymnopus androsaceus JB14]